MDYNQPWGWNTQQKKPQQGNTIAPLGGGNTEGTPSPIMTGPSTEDQLIQGVGTAMVDQAASGMARGVSDYAAGTAAGAGLDVLGPLGAAFNGAMKGEYDEAAGAAAGTVLGTAFLGPVGGAILGKLGGHAGNAVGSIFGLADGTTAVKKQPEKGIAQTIWDKIVAKGAEAVQASTGNSGGLGQAKQALVSRKERLEQEERKALGYADGTAYAGGKSVGGPAINRNTMLNRPFGSTAPTGYYNQSPGMIGSTPATQWRPGAFTTSAQQATAQAVPTAKSVWASPPQAAESFGGGVGGK